MGSVDLRKTLKADLRRRNDYYFTPMMWGLQKTIQYPIGDALSLNINSHINITLKEELKD